MDNEERYRLTYKEWRKFMKGESDINPDIIPEEILASWMRCRDLGLDPIRKPRFERMPENALRELLDRNRELIEISHPYIASFYHFLKDTGFRITLHDHRGIVLDGLLEMDLYERFVKVNVVVGASFGEADVGTCTTTIINASKKPIQVFGPQHYNGNFHKDTGSGAPIFDPEGNFIGVFAISARYHRANDHTLGMAVAAARAIENELRIQRMLKEVQIANSYKDTVISSITEALIALDSKGRISLLNKKAEKLFRLEGEQVEGKYLSELFGEENRHFLELIENNDAIQDREVRIVAKGLGNDLSLSCSPILTPGGAMIGKILVINEIRRVKTRCSRKCWARRRNCTLMISAVPANVSR